MCRGVLAPRGRAWFLQGDAAGSGPGLRVWRRTVLGAAMLESRQYVFQRISRSLHQHRGCTARIATQLSADFKAVHAWQRDVQQDAVVIVADRQMQAGDTVAGMIDHVVDDAISTILLEQLL